MKIKKKKKKKKCLVTKPYGIQTQQLLHKNDELGQNCVSGHNLLEQTLVNTCATCEHFDNLKIIFLYARVVKKESPNT